MKQDKSKEARVFRVIYRIWKYTVLSTDEPLTFQSTIENSVSALSMLFEREFIDCAKAEKIRKEVESEK